MTRRTNPTRVVETGRLARGSSGQPLGWLQSLGDRANQIMAKIMGVQDRLHSPFTNGVPSSVGGELTFKADINKTVTITSFPTDPDANPPAAFTTLLVNPILLAGVTYKIPIQFSPPGVLRADKLVVGVEAGFLMFAGQNRPGITPLNDYRQLDTLGGFVVGPAADAIQYTWQQQVLGNFASVQPFLPFLWNIVDAKSGRKYANDWMPHGALLNTRGGARDGIAQHNDSELFEFDAPWLIERDGEVEFHFRPIMDLYQIAANDATLPFTGDDDRNPPGATTAGARIWQATVRVEFHGNRYYDVQGQDVLKEGAYLTNDAQDTPVDLPRYDRGPRFGGMR